MTEYHKIQSVFKRDPDTNYRTFLYKQWSMPEFGFLQDCEWVWTEKVDGTNIRIIVDEKGNVDVRGKTDKATLHIDLFNNIHDLFMEDVLSRDKLKEAFPEGAVLYGEGYGAGIQKGGGNYRSDKGFVLFDVRVGHWWLQRDAVECVASNLGLDVVPIVGSGTLWLAIAKCMTGFKSQWGDFDAEGLICKPRVELMTRSGRRVITKIKCKDFENEG